MSTQERVLKVIEADYNITLETMTDYGVKLTESAAKLRKILSGLAMDWADESFLDVVEGWLEETKRALAEEDRVEHEEFGSDSEPGRGNW